MPCAGPVNACGLAANHAATASSHRPGSSIACVPAFRSVPAFSRGGTAENGVPSPLICSCGTLGTVERSTSSTGITAGGVNITNACATGWDQLIAAQLDYRTRPCNLAELLPRLREV